MVILPHCTGSPNDFSLNKSLIITETEVFAAKVHKLIYHFNEYDYMSDSKTSTDGFISFKNSFQIILLLIMTRSYVFPHHAKCMILVPKGELKTVFNFWHVCFLSSNRWFVRCNTSVQLF